MRVRIIVLVTAVLLFGAIMTVPRIIEASKSSAGDNAQSNSVVANPAAGTKTGNHCRRVDPQRHVDRRSAR